MQYNITYTSFRIHVNGVRKSKRCERKNGFVDGEVKQLTKHCVTMAEQGDGLKSTTLKMKFEEHTSNSFIYMSSFGGHKLHQSKATHALKNISVIIRKLTK